jgi:diguanylate cyclase (GGDEF)-like protein/PAS domain S-box-containing protein
MLDSFSSRSEYLPSDPFFGASEPGLDLGHVRQARDALMNTSLWSVFQTDPDAELIVDAEGLIVLANPKAEQLFHAGAGELTGQALEEAPPEGEYAYMPVYLPGRKKASACLQAMGLPGTQGQLRRVRIHPRHESRHGLEALEKQGSTLHALLQAAPLGFVAVNLSGRVTLWNTAARRILGWSALELQGQSLPCTAKDPANNLQSVFERALQGQLYEALELPQQQKSDGETVDLQVWTAELRQPSGISSGILMILADVTAQRRIRAHILRLVGHHPLTGLPNRRQFKKQLARTLHKRSKRDKNPLIVLQLGLDRFKRLSRLLGPARTDSLLQAVAHRLSASLYETDVIAHTEDEVFSVMLRHTRHISEGARVAEKLRHQLAAPFDVEGDLIAVHASIGIAVFPNDGTEADALIRAADLAMERARESGAGESLYYTQDLDLCVRQELSLERGLQTALNHHAFFLEYQPQFDVSQGRIVGVEALIRWQHPELGLISPAQFIPLAEASGLIVPIGAWVLKTALCQLAAWDQAGLPPLRMAVNLSARQLHDPGLLEMLTDALEVSGVAAHRLELEVTESLLLRNTGLGIEVLGQIREQGVRLALDDFGTGYSSLAYLADMPIDTLKIDRSFVRDIGHKKTHRLIIQAIVALASALSLKTVAEGVESAEELEAMRWLGCDEIQGFFISRPLRPEALALRLAEGEGIVFVRSERRGHSGCTDDL